MNFPFHRPLRTEEEITEHKAHRVSEAVARILDGVSDPRMPYVQGHTDRSLIAHRELEIRTMTDHGWGDIKAILIMKHHAHEAVATAEAFASSWSFNTERGGPGGWNNLHIHVCRMIRTLRTRVDPALCVAEAEFDPEQILRRIYLEVEYSHLKKAETIKCKFDKLRSGATSHGRAKIRAQERRDFQCLLESMFNAVGTWENELINASRKAGF